MKIAIIGSRPKYWKYPEFAQRSVERYVQLKMTGDDVLISGGAQGPDTWALDAWLHSIDEGDVYQCPELTIAERTVFLKGAGEDAVEVARVFHPIWKRPDGSHDKGAGFKRNIKIILECDKVVAFWDGTSKGTEHSINLAREHDRELLIINPDLHVPAHWYEDSMAAF